MCIVCQVGSNFQRFLFWLHDHCNDLPGFLKMGQRQFDKMSRNIPSIANIFSAFRRSCNSTMVTDIREINSYTCGASASVHHPMNLQKTRKNQPPQKNIASGAFQGTFRLVLTAFPAKASSMIEGRKTCCGCRSLKVLSGYHQ